MNETTKLAAAEYATGVPIEELLGRAVRSGQSVRRGGRGEPRWVRVMGLFAIGSTSAQALCRAYGVDPDEVVARR